MMQVVWYVYLRVFLFLRRENMFRIFKNRAKESTVNAPVTGVCIDITEVKDEAFSSKLMGDGLAFVPEESTVYAPCNGKIDMIFPSMHAFGIKRDDGLQVLVHIGIDTVNLNGKGFQTHKRVNDKVRQGEPIISFDSSKFDQKYDMTVMLLIVDNGGSEYEKLKVGEKVDCGTIVLQKKA